MENEMQEILGAKCYIDSNNVAWLSLEAVARGLGFTTVATSGNEVVRWNRVNKYLADVGVVQKCTTGDFIPENVFYRLAMKAKNEAAEQFQAKVADEIIPSIRKHGAYMTPEVIEKTLCNPDFIIKLATELKAEQQKNKEPTTANKMLSAETLQWSDRKIVSRVVRLMASKAKTQFAYIWNELYKELYYKHGIALRARGNSPYIQYVHEDEWGKVQQTLSALCEKYDLNISEIVKLSKQEDENDDAA